MKHLKKTVSLILAFMIALMPIFPVYFSLSLKLFLNFFSILHCYSLLSYFLMVFLNYNIQFTFFPKKINTFELKLQISSLNSSITKISRLCGLFLLNLHGGNVKNETFEKNSFFNTCFYDCIDARKCLCSRNGKNKRCNKPCIVRVVPLLHSQ